ncbi:MAG: hypothetical protein Q8R06_02135 [Polaromonas sp.]|nr:hypothetical protein [Polaromonas sp.]
MKTSRRAVPSRLFRSFVASFARTAQGTGTLLVFDHAGFPDGTGEHLETGWHANYWEPLKRHLRRT